MSLSDEDMQFFMEAKRKSPKIQDSFVVDDLIVSFLKKSPSREQFETFVDDCLLSKTFLWAIWDGNK